VQTLWTPPRFGESKLMSGSSGRFSAGLGSGKFRPYLMSASEECKDCQKNRSSHPSALTWTYSRNRKVDRVGWSRLPTRARIHGIVCLESLDDEGT
jgi:hypothetical protein